MKIKPYFSKMFSNDYQQVNLFPDLIINNIKFYTLYTLKCKRSLTFCLRAPKSVVVAMKPLLISWANKILLEQMANWKIWLSSPIYKNKSHLKGLKINLQNSWEMEQQMEFLLHPVHVEMITKLTFFTKLKIVTFLYLWF